MNTNNVGKVMIIFLTITNFSLFCADRSQSFLNRSGSGYSDQSQSSSSSSVSISPGSWGETLYNSMYALKRTVDHMTPDGAFVAIGWPTTDPEARKEMRRNREIYEQVVSSEIDQQKRQELLQTVGNRTAFLLKAYNSLLSRPDGVSFAEHCVKNHLPAMNDPLKLAFQLYLDKKAQESARASVNAQKCLTLPTNQSLKTDSTSTIDHRRDLPNASDGNNIATILLKIGWPSEGNKTKAQTYLEKCLNAYKIKKAFNTIESRKLLQNVDGRALLEITEGKTTDKMINNLQACKSFIALREKWMRTIYEFLPQRLDGVKLAWFCLTSHKYVIPQSLQDDYRRFIEEQQQEYADIFNQIGNASGQYQ